VVPWSSEGVFGGYAGGMLRRVVLGWFALAGLAAIPAAHAVIVRGRVTDALGKPLPGSRVQLIRLTDGPKSAADTIAGLDGYFEVRTDLGGRFLLLTSPSIVTQGYAPQIGGAFYGGSTDLIVKDVALNAGEITPQVSALERMVQVPLKQLSDAPVQVVADQLLWEATVVPVLRAQAGMWVVQRGQVGTEAELFRRGAPVEKVLVDEVSAERLGGGYDFGRLTSFGLGAVASTAAIEVGANANPVHGVDAGASVVGLMTAVGSATHRTLVYSGDWGNLSTVRNEAVGSIAQGRTDALVSFGRLNTANDEPSAKVHLVTSAANLGYRIGANTGVRLTLREDLGAAPMASPYAYYQVAPKTKLATQNLVGGVTIETTTVAGWRNQLRYGLMRERTQAYNYETPARGVPVTIQGANGYTTVGKATFLPTPVREDAVTNRDEGSYETDYKVKRRVQTGLVVRYGRVRGADLQAGRNYRVSRGHLTVAGSVAGHVRHRVFLDGSGFVDHSSDGGWHGAPRVGATWVVKRAGLKKFRGTSVHGTAAAGVGELSTVQTGQVGAGAAVPKSKTYDVGLEQALIPRKLMARATYFHGAYSHQAELLGLVPVMVGNGLGYRTQGIEAVLEYHPGTRVVVAGGYTYTASVVRQSGAVGVVNPNLPGVAIGATTALAGARPFDRPTNTGFVEARYTGTAFSAAIHAGFAGVSDGTTGLVLDPKLLLPNRNLTTGYGSVEASFAYNVTHAVTVYGAMTNLLNDRHIAPAGYESTPFGVRVGVRVRLGRE
jgi:vitamin B12 transporter